MDYYDSNRRSHPSDAGGYGPDDTSRHFYHPPRRNYRGPHDSPDFVGAFRQDPGASISGFAASGTQRAVHQNANLDEFGRWACQARYRAEYGQDRALMADTSLFDNNSISTARLSLPTRHARSNYSSSPFFDPAHTQGRRTNGQLHPPATQFEATVTDSYQMATLRRCPPP